jgi:hypothetical protein
MPLLMGSAADTLPITGRNDVYVYVCVCIHGYMIMCVFVRASSVFTSFTVVDTALQWIPVCSWKIISIIAVLRLEGVAQKNT